MLRRSRAPRSRATTLLVPVGVPHGAWTGRREARTAAWSLAAARVPRSIRARACRPLQSSGLSCRPAGTWAPPPSQWSSASRCSSSSGSARSRARLSPSVSRRTSCGSERCGAPPNEARRARSRPPRPAVRALRRRHDQHAGGPPEGGVDRKRERRSPTSSAAGHTAARPETASWRGSSSSRSSHVSRSPSMTLRWSWPGSVTEPPATPARRDRVHTAPSRRVTMVRAASTSSGGPSTSMGTSSSAIHTRKLRDQPPRVVTSDAPSPSGSTIA